jgi:hypothetical protein
MINLSMLDCSSSLASASLSALAVLPILGGASSCVITCFMCLMAEPILVDSGRHCSRKLTPLGHEGIYVYIYIFCALKIKKVYMGNKEEGMRY